MLALISKEGIHTHTQVLTDSEGKRKHVYISCSITGDLFNQRQTKKVLPISHCHKCCFMFLFCILIIVLYNYLLKHILISTNSPFCLNTLDIY